MTATFRTTLNITQDVFFRMAVFVWGFVWLLMSVLIFLAGRLVPRLQSKPPPPAQVPRAARTRSAQASPILSPPKSIVSEPDEAASCKSSFDVPVQPDTLPVLTGTPPKKAPPKRKWSLPTRFFSGRSAPSPKSSLFSEGSATLVDSPSSTRFFPDLPLVESTSPSSDPGHVPDLPESLRSSPTSTPRTGRGMRLPGAKVLKSLSRKMSTKKPETARNQSQSPRASVDMLHSRNASLDFDLGEDEMRKERRSDMQARPTHLMHQRQMSLPGEVFSSTFVNPFRSKSRKPKAPPALDLADSVARSPSPSPKRSTTRRMLTSFQLALSSSSPSPKSPPELHSSRRSSVSSTSTAVSALSAPSVLAAAAPPAGSSPRSVPRTQPYAAPYFAPMPRAARPASRERDGRKRASSMSPPRRPETVAEESAEEPGEPLSPLGLKLGQLGHGRPSSAPRAGRHRVAVSEGAMRVEGAPER